MLFVWDGFPPACICNNVKEMIQGTFYHKLKDVACHLKQLEPYIPWSNTAEQEIKELKKGAGHKLLWSRAPKCLWDDCLELEAYIRSDTTHDIYQLDGEVPKTVISHKTSDISQFCKLDRFEWVMFQNETALFPDDVLKLGHFLGPSIYIGPTITAKIFKQNGQVLHRSTYTPDEIADKDRSDAREQFMVRVHEKSGPQVLPRELEDIGLEITPQNDPYEDKTQNEQSFP